MRLPRLWFVLVLCVGIASLLGMGFLFIKSPSDDADIPHCRPIYMFPSYARMVDFDEKYTPLASKYLLYLYREQNVDYDPEDEHYLKGIPVIFIPGNAGSFRQVRLIAAEAANVFVGNPGVYGAPLDFFTVDFNEDFTAFHGKTLMDQAEFLNQAIAYILLIYKHQDNPPTSVVILAHSMGGLVARVLLALESYVPASVNTIVTLSTPHSAAPLTFDGDILRAYSLADRFWYDAFHSKLDNSELHAIKDAFSEMALISITGGGPDTTLPADYTTLGFLVPPEHGFTVYTSGIPGVWTPMDHLAIVWCDQLRKTLGRMLLDVTDASKPIRVKPLAARMDIFRKALLPGLDEAKKADPLMDIFLEDPQIEFVAEIAASQKTFPNANNEFYGFDLAAHAEKVEFVMLSAIPVANWDENESSFLVLLCLKNVDSKGYRCTDAYDMASLVPRPSSPLESSSFGGEKLPYHALRLNSSYLDGYEFILISKTYGDTDLSSDNKFVLDARLSVQNDDQELGNRNSLHLLGGSIHKEFHVVNSIVLKIYIPNAWSSLFAYNLQVKIPKSSLNEELFTPFLRQFLVEPFETKWHTQLGLNNNLVLTMHGIAPYTPFRVDKRHGMSLELWCPTNAGDTVMVSMSINFFESFRLLMLRYRLALAAFTILVTLMAFLVQMNHFVQSGVFPSVVFGLSKLCNSKILGYIVIVTGLLNALVNKRSVQMLLDYIDPVVLQDPNEINTLINQDFKLNSFYLGLEESYMVLLGPIFFSISLTFVWITYYLVMLISNVVSTAADFYHRKLNKSRTVRIPLETTLTDKLTDSMRDISSLSNLLTETGEGGNRTHREESASPAELDPEMVSISPRRVILNIVLVLAIVFSIPYQFAYVICCLVQAFTCIRISWQPVATKTQKNNLNYMVTLLILMLWTLPVNVPVLVVYIHNVAIRWSTPFSSHHNVLAILPTLMLVQGHLMGLMLPGVANSKKYNLVTICYVSVYIFYCVLYGVRHTFWLHHLFNVFACWLLILRQ